MLSRARRWAAITTTATFASVTLALAATASTGDDGVPPTMAPGSPSCTGPAPAVPDAHAVLLANDGALPLSAHERTVVVVATPTAGDDDTSTEGGGTARATASPETAPVPTVDVVLTELLGRDVPRVTADDLLSSDDEPARAPDAADDPAAAPVAVVVLAADDPWTEVGTDAADVADPADPADSADPADGSADVPTGLDTVAALDAAGWDVVVTGPRTEVLAGLAAVGPDGDTVLLEHVSAALALGSLPDAATESSGDVEPDAGADTDTGTDRLATLLVGERAPAGLLTEPVPAPEPGDETVPEPSVLLEAGHGLRYAAADLDGAEPEAVEPRGSVLRIDLVGTGTVPGAVPVHVDAQDGDTWTELACTVVDLEPGAVESATVTVPAAAEPREVRVRTATDVLETTVPATTPDGAPPSPTASPSDEQAEAPDTHDSPSSTDEQDPAPAAEDAVEPVEPVEPGGEADDDATPPATTQEPRTDASIPLHARIPESTTPPSSGTLRLTIGDGTVSLGEAERLTDRWHLTGSLPTVTVEDDRAHAAGWTVSVQGHGLSGPAGTLGAERLGWTPTAPERQGLAVGPDVASTLAGGPGLAEPAVLATARGAARHGPVELGARLDLETPLDTPPGDYAGALTVTLFPVD